MFRRCIRVAAAVLAVSVLGSVRIAQAESPAAVTSAGSRTAVLTEDAGPYLPDDGVLPVQVGVEEDTDPVFLITYEEIAQNNRLVLYADKSKGLFALKNKSTGKIWYSTPNDILTDPKTKGKLKQNLQSQILLSFIYKEDENTNTSVEVANSQVSCINNGEVKVTLIPDGMRVEYGFTELGVMIPVEYTLQGSCLKASIDFENMVEGEECLIISIQLLPSMGAGNWEEEGYLFLPDGCGAIMDFNNNVNMLSYYEAPVYGRELGIVQNTQPSRSEQIYMPVFGTVIGNDALMGVIHQGDGSASIFAYNGNDNTGYNAVSSKVVLRTHNVVDSFYETNHKTDILQVSHVASQQTAYEVLYCPLDGEKASYVGMAQTYRAYLESAGLERQPQSAAMAVDFYGAVDRKANLLGFSYNKLEPLTTFEQAQAILEDMKAHGFNDLAVRYIGWNNNGILNKKVPVKADALGVLGGNKAFDAFSQFLNSNGYAFYPETDWIRFRSGGGGVSRLFDGAKTPSGNDALQYEYLLSVYETKLTEDPYKLLTPTKLAEVSSRFLEAYEQRGVDALSVGMIGRAVYSDFRDEGGVHRADLPDIYCQILQQMQDKEICMAFSGANAYVLPYASYIYETPIYSSGYDIFARDVPFYQIVLHGYVGMTVPEIVQSIEPEVTFLKAVETGSSLLYACIAEDADILMNTRYAELYGSTYSLWAEDAAALYGQYRDLFERICDKTITAHDQVGDNVFVTEFEGGIRVAVNYGDSDVQFEGTNIGAMSFTELKG